MKLAFQLAYRNLIGAGLRTWLNVAVLSFAFVIIIFFNGMLDGWNLEAKRDTIAWEYGYGHLQNKDYDPYDPFTIQDGHGILPEKNEQLTPILIQQATVYPQGRMISVALKGIDAKQNVLELPTQALLNSEEDIPVVIGKRMAKSIGLEKGDKVLMRWRDKNGTFDAANITIAEVFSTNVPTIDNGQIWISIDKLWELTGLERHATFFVANENYSHEKMDGWKFLSQEDLLSEFNKVMKSKNISSSIMYLLLLAIALLAVFDTQVLSIFRRQKEIGTYIALGMTRWRVAMLFTLEGSVYSIMAMIVGTIYGTPLLAYLAKVGIPMPDNSEQAGLAIGDKIFPVYGITLILGTIALMVISATIVSFLPARKIAKMDPVDALKGKLQ